MIGTKQRCVLVFGSVAAVLGVAAVPVVALGSPANGSIVYAPVIQNECALYGGPDSGPCPEPAQPRLRVARPDGHVLRRLPCSVPTRRCRSESTAFSPEGRRVAVASKTQVTLTGPGGRSVRSVGFSADGFQWSPDGRSLALVGQPRERSMGRGLYVWRVSQRGPEPTALSPAILGPPAWSPDGRSLAFTRFDEFPDPRQPLGDRTRASVRTVSVDGATESEIFARSGIGAAIEIGLSWSARGRLAWTAGLGPGNIFSSRPPRQDNSRLLRAARGPEFSPDGRRVIFLCRRGLCIARSDGTRRGLLTRRCNAGFYPYGWSPDSQEVVCSTYGRSIVESSGIVRIDSQSGRLIQTLTKRDAFFVDWLPARADRP